MARSRRIAGSRVYPCGDNAGACSKQSVDATILIVAIDEVLINVEDTGACHDTSPFGPRDPKDCVISTSWGLGTNSAQRLDTIRPTENRTHAEMCLIFPLTATGADCTSRIDRDCNYSLSASAVAVHISFCYAILAVLTSASLISNLARGQRWSALVR
ncbi:hypothetical protein B0H21DRAFT_175785 [Amylocystis lapponica]|nr:hypothetical protein B0H21DRAFT_175785 [Amylocystis lapponica]